MAGIGFKLRAMTEEKSLSGLVKGYSYSAVIMAGPWLATIITVATVASLGDGLPRFQALITHVYPLSLIWVGLFQFPITRYLADRLYLGESGQQVPAFNASLSLILIPMLLTGVVWGCTTPDSVMPAPERWCGVVLLLTVSAEWVVLLYLMVIRRFMSIVWSFLIGDGASLFLGTFLGSQYGELGASLGFSMGQSAGLILLLWAFLQEYPGEQEWNWDFVQWVRRAPTLAACGFFYYLGSFMDKLVFRYGSLLVESPYVGQVTVAPWFWVCERYETMGFLGQLTVVPAMALFFLRVETDFFENYRAFYSAIDRRASLTELQYYRNQILAAMKEGATALLTVQGTFTLVAVLAAPELFPWVSMDYYDLYLLRLAIVASFLHISTLFLCVMMLYFELYTEAFQVTFLFFALNTVLTVLSLYAGPLWHGWGFVVAGLVSCCAAGALLWTRVKSLEYVTFARNQFRLSGFPGTHETGIGLRHDLSRFRGDSC